MNCCGVKDKIQWTSGYYFRNVILLNQIHSGIFPFQEDIATNGIKDGGDSKSTIENNEEIPVDKETLFAHQDNDTNDDAMGLGGGGGGHYLSPSNTIGEDKFMKL